MASVDLCFGGETNGSRMVQLFLYDKSINTFFFFHSRTALCPIGRESIIIQWKQRVCIESNHYALGEANQKHTELTCPHIGLDIKMLAAVG